MPLEGEDCFSNQYYTHIRRLLILVGLWPNIKISKRLFPILFINLMITVGIVSQIWILVLSERTVEKVTEFLQTFLPTFLFAATYWNLLYNSALIKEAVERVRNDWYKLTCEDELNLMRTYATQSKVCSQSIACAFFLYIAFLTFPSIIRFFLYISGIIDKTKITLPVHYEAFMTTQVTYISLLSLETTITTTICIIGIANYTVFISLLQHACALFIIVTIKIDRPFIKNKYKFSWTQTAFKRKDEFRWIVTVIENYNNAAKFVELIRLLYGKIYTIEVSVAVCFIIVDFIYYFQFITLMVSLSKILKNCLYIAVTMLTISGYTYIMQRLTDHSNSVYEQCRLISFYKLSIETNKLLLQLITQTMTSCNFSIQGIIVCSHEDFVKLMKASFSFATICYKMR